MTSTTGPYCGKLSQNAEISNFDQIKERKSEGANERIHRYSLVHSLFHSFTL